MDKAHFTTKAAALSHRASAGGWIFARDDGRFIVYAFAWTASRIMLDPDNRGHNGTLI